MSSVERKERKAQGRELVKRERKGRAREMGKYLKVLFTGGTVGHATLKDVIMTRASCAQCTLKRNSALCAFHSTDLDVTLLLHRFQISDFRLFFIFHFSLFIAVRIMARHQ